jgi:hypothetical protein
MATVKRATGSKRPYGVPKGSLYRPTSASGGLGTFGSGLPQNTPGTSYGNPVQALPQANFFQEISAALTGNYNQSLNYGNNATPLMAGVGGSLAGVPLPVASQQQAYMLGNVSAPTPYAGFQTPPNSTYVPQQQAQEYEDYAQRNKGTPPPTPSATGRQQRPAGFYTGNPNDPNTAAWKAYWNDMATNPQNYIETNAPPKVMGLDEIREMKLAQKRRQQWKAAGDAPEVPKETFDRNVYASNLAWNWRLSAG